MESLSMSTVCSSIRLKCNISFFIVFIFTLTNGFSQTREVKTEFIKGISMVKIPAGTFEMGAQSEWGEWTEKPVHTVTLDGFYMSKTHVTQAQYEAMMGKNPSHFTGDDNLPVDSVDWFDAAKFCNRLNDYAGFERCYDEETWDCDFSKNSFRLPTEAEWEYACRAGTTTMFNLGDTWRDLDRAGWYCGNSGGKTHPVGRKEPNAFGLYDMHGNMWEWCNDYWMENYYDYSPAHNPRGPDYSFARVVRGGRFYGSVRHNRAAIRGGNSPDNGYSASGFRLVRSP